MRCKFKVQSVTEQMGWGGHDRLYSVKLNPVTSGSEENKAFYAATPGGQIDLSVLDAEIGKRFPVGSEVFVDFTPAEAGV